MRDTLAVIDLAALKANFRAVRAKVAPARIWSVVKADGYGHGLLEVARSLADAGSDGLAVATVDEALNLRQAGIGEPLLLMEGIFSPEDLDLVREHRLQLVLHEAWQIDALSEAGANRSADASIPVWFKLDTGMHRLGFSMEHAHGQWKRLSQIAQVSNPPGLMTHFACADRPNQEATQRQWQRLERWREEYAGPRHGPISAANSAAILSHPYTLADWVRPGLMLYGASPLSDDSGLDHGLKPVMTFCSQVIALKTVPAGGSVGYGGRWRAPRDSQVAILGVGYGDGYPRHARDGTPVHINGQTGRLVGTVSMDMLAVDVTDINDVQIGSQAVLWGQELPVETVARWSDTIAWELLTGVSSRVPRKYIDDA